MELVATRKYTVFGRSRRRAEGKHGEGGANGEGVRFDREVPTMRLREMINANASRYAHGPHEVEHGRKYFEVLVCLGVDSECLGPFPSVRFRLPPFLPHAVYAALESTAGDPTMRVLANA